VIHLKLALWTRTDGHAPGPGPAPFPACHRCRQTAPKAVPARVCASEAGMLVAGALLLGGTIAFLFINRRLIYDYYAQSMFLNSEKEIRASENHTVTFADHLLFYPRPLFLDHLGAPLLTSVVVLKIGALAWAMAVRGRRPHVIWEDLRRWSVHLAFLCITIALPLLLLNLSLEKSLVIGGVLFVPFLCLVLILIAALLGLRWLRSSEQFPRFDKCHSTGFEGCGNFMRRPRRVAG
jgi:hypothetical protein